MVQVDREQNSPLVGSPAGHGDMGQADNLGGPVVGERRVAPGHVQMARDELILRRAARTGQATIRLYGWERLTLSVGRAQHVEQQIDVDACRRLGVPIVRRMTGGRAVLHGTDLTYAVAAPLAGLGAGPLASAARDGVPGLYRELSRVFVHLFEELGFAPRVEAYSRRQRAELASPVCFATPSAFEILLDGKKLVGSAQRLIPNAFLQHGSIPLVPQGEVLAQVFRDGAGEAMAEVMTDLTTAGILPRLPINAVRERLLECFRAEFGLTLAPMEWSAEDDAVVTDLAGGYGDVAAELKATTPFPAGRDAALPS
jgi:lipoate-protein ligase A